MSYLINKYGVRIMLLLVTLEYACFPLPSEVLLPLCGFVSKGQNVPFLFIVVVSTICGLIGVLICYFLGRLLGYRFLLFIVRKIPKTYDKVEKTKRKYLKNSNKYVCIGRLLPVCRTYISFFSGIYKQKLNNFIIYSGIGIFIWNFVLIGLGYFFYDKIDIKFFYNNYKLVFLIIMSIYLVLFVIKSEIFRWINLHKK